MALNHKPLKVRKRRCVGCLYGKTPVVGLDAAIPHRERLRKFNAADPQLFPCHCHSIIDGQAVVCRGWHDDNKHLVNPAKVEFITTPGDQEAMFARFKPGEGVLCERPGNGK